jgi:LuxR family glucitol operon transcriptional activator
MALFPTPTVREALIEVAIPDSDPHTAEDAIVQLQTLSLISQEKSSPDGNSRYNMLPLTREYVLVELKANPDFEQQARERWVNWYIGFSEAYSKEDAGAWLGQFEGLDEEWQNLQAVADWCMAEAHYDQVLQLWQNLRPYTYVIGRRINRMRYSNAGLTWTNWLIQTASQRGDWNVATQSMFDCAWILVATGKPKPLEEAGRLLEQAWELRHYQDLKHQVNLARYIAVLRIKQQKYEEARTWLSQSEDILQQAELDDHKQVEYLSQTRYYQGMTYLKAGEIDASKSYFEEAQNYARSFKLERLVQVIETSLADVAVQQGDLDQAERLLVEGLKIAEANADQCRAAFIKQSFAGLAKARGNLSEAQRYATEAFSLFERLGMMAEADEVQAFIDCKIFSGT